MRKHGIDLEDNPVSDGSRTKRLDRKDLDALMGGDGRSGIFTWREKNRRKVKAIALVLARSSHISDSMHLSVGLLRVSEEISAPMQVPVADKASVVEPIPTVGASVFRTARKMREPDSTSQWRQRLFVAKAIHSLVTGGA